MVSHANGLPSLFPTLARPFCPAAQAECREHDLPWEGVPRTTLLKAVAVRRQSLPANILGTQDTLKKAVKKEQKRVQAAEAAGGSIRDGKRVM